MRVLINFIFPTPNFVLCSFSEVTQDIWLKSIFCTTLFDVNIIFSDAVGPYT